MLGWVYLSQIQMLQIFYIAIGMLYLLSNPRDIPVDDLVSEEDVVVVTLSYRVNAFGFFSYEDPLMPGLLI